MEKNIVLWEELTIRLLSNNNNFGIGIYDSKNRRPISYEFAWVGWWGRNKELCLQIARILRWEIIDNWIFKELWTPWRWNICTSFSDYDPKDHLTIWIENDHLIANCVTQDREKKFQILITKVAKESLIQVLMIQQWIISDNNMNKNRL